VAIPLCNHCVTTRLPRRRFAPPRNDGSFLKRILKFFKRNRKLLFSFLALVLFAAFLFLILAKERNMSFSFLGILEQKAEEENKNVSPLSGLPCDNYKQRPIAVMLANDEAARPLSGLSGADMVFEMQVVEDSITRLMAVFVCNSPIEIGSIRSARHDFIPLAMGLDAIYAHWGGSHFALDKLKAKIMDNIDAMTNPYDSFFRKLGISAPHNGFSSIFRLTNSAEKLGYRLENGLDGYQHQIQNLKPKIQNPAEEIKINYAYPWNVEWEYNVENNSYLRWRGGRAEIDRNNGEQIEAKSIVVMYAKSRPLEGQYNDVDVEGGGDIVVYQNGGKIKGRWKKDKNNLKSKLYFLDEQGREIKFVPGQIWVEIIEPGK